MSNNKQSSVRWVIEELGRFELGTSEFFSKTAIINHADRLHKEEIGDAYSLGYGDHQTLDWHDLDEYYNETYESNS